MNWTKLRNPRFLFWGYCFLILIGSSIPSHSMPKIELLTFDKIIHFSEYFIFGWLFFRVYRQTPEASQINLLLFIPLIFPVIDESWQRFIPGRDPSIYDSIADWIGIAFGYGLGYFLSSHD